MNVLHGLSPKSEVKGGSLREVQKRRAVGFSFVVCQIQLHVYRVRHIWKLEWNLGATCMSSP